MSLQLTNLSVLAYANNFTLWHYKTEDSDVLVEGYFNNADAMMRENDLIIVNVNVNNNPLTMFLSVTETGSLVTVSRLI